MSRNIEGFILPHNMSSVLPNKMLFYDCETDYIDDGRVQHHFFKMGWSCYLERSAAGIVSRKRWTFHEDEESFLDLIDRRAYSGTTLYLIGHNISFDLAVSGFYREYGRRGWKLDFFYDAGLTHIMSLKKVKRKIRILSTTNYFTFSLDDLGKVLNLPKGSVDFDSAGWEELKSYCQQDVRITREAFLYWLQYVQINGLGKFGLTKSSQAFNAYRHKFMNNQIFIHKEQASIELERSAYMGGRTEAFYIGKAKEGPFISLDINSQYPFIMKDKKLPSKLIESGQGMKLSVARNLLKEFGMIAEVEVETDLPALACRGKSKILYPVGRFTTWVCTPGLKLALSRGWVKRIKSWSAYEMDYLFDKYIDFFYQEKKLHTETGNEVFRQMAKYYMNTLYGKFGQKRKVEDRIVVDAPDTFSRQIIFDQETGKVWTETILFNVCLTTYHETNGKNTFVAIPAHVTEYGRLMIWDIIESLGPKKCFYCDTDSVKIRKADLGLVKHPIHESDLGALSLEETFKTFTVYGCKDYKQDQIVKVKGVPKKAVELSDGKFIYSQFDGFMTNLRASNTDTVRIRKVVKKLAREYDKGIVGPDGWVRPYLLPDPSAPV